MAILLKQFMEIVGQSAECNALFHGDRVSTYADLAAQANITADQLRVAGVGPGCPLVISKQNGADVAAAVVATWMLKSVPVFVSPNAPSHHLDHAIKASHARGHLSDTGLVATEADSGPHEELGPDAGSVVFTSGSTGMPKGVIQSQTNLLTGPRRIGRLLEIDHRDRVACPVPWSHDYGWGQLLNCLMLGIPLVLPLHQSVQSLSDSIELHRPTLLAGTPALFAGMCFGISNIRNADLSSIKKITSTGSRLAPELVVELQALIPTASVYANYGMTETYRTSCLLPTDRPQREASVGKAIEGCKLTIIDENGNELPPHVVGEVVHHGAGVFTGYLGDAFRTRKTRTSENGVRTGDLGFLDEDGFLFLVGRRDRMIKTMDVQVSLDEVEDLLTKSRMVRQLAVTSSEHPMLGRRIEAHVCLIDPESAKEFKAFARKSLGKYQLPRVFNFVETLPQTASGKINYSALSNV